MFRQSVILCVAVTMICGILSVAEAQSSRKNVPGQEILKSYLGYKPLTVGDVGKVGAFVLIQVVDEDNAVVEIKYYPGVPLATLQTETVWMNISTKGMVDDHTYPDTRKFEITGTKKYDTADGSSKTVFVLKPKEDQPNVDKAKQDAKAAANRAAAEAKLNAEREKQSKEDTRTWTAASGGKTLKATFSGRIVDKVRLKKEDGTVITVTLDQLNDEDQAWIQNRSKR